MNVKRAWAQAMQRLGPKEWRELSAFVRWEDPTEQNNIHPLLEKLGEALRNQGLTNRDETALWKEIIDKAARIREVGKGRHSRIQLHGEGRFLFPVEERANRALANWMLVTLRYLEEYQSRAKAFWVKFRQFWAYLVDKFLKLIGKIETRARNMTRADLGNGIIQGLLKKGIGYSVIGGIWIPRGIWRGIGFTLGIPKRFYHWVIDFYPVMAEGQGDAHESTC